MPDQPNEGLSDSSADRTQHRQTLETSFDEYYYAHDCGIPYERNEHWLTFFGHVADGIVRQIGPATVLDVGCAMGFLVEALRERGVEAWGVDVSDYAIESVDHSIVEYCGVASADGPLPPDFPTTFDLVTCVEAVEHMEALVADAAIANLCRWGRRVLLSSSSTDYGEPTHVNVQRPEHWAAKFASNGFLRSFDVDVTFLTAWATLFEPAVVVAPAVVARYEREYAEMRLENIQLRSRLLDSEQSRAELEARVRELEDQPMRAGGADMNAAVDRAVAADLRAMQLRDRASMLQSQVDERERTMWELLRRLEQADAGHGRDRPSGSTS